MSIKIEIMIEIIDQDHKQGRKIVQFKHDNVYPTTSWRGTRKAIPC